ncbi:hypothetical protein [Streptomyces sp. SID3343]|uniref:hypothetical protein n=1 Tax=Streptomyces sp. SID3343 TaxID=2690260 RepID=UPI00136D74B8|nr:hypothetical protein [Streptomyces sp. SID3343]MYV99134.1 hypothetical protein [Streptomyces sp. SID3343]
MVHDVGKGQCAWRDGLLGEVRTGMRVERPPHRNEGTLPATRHLPAWFLAGPVDGHHARLAHGEKLRARIKAMIKNPGDRNEVIARVAARVPEITPQKPITMPEAMALGRTDPVAHELLVRMLFSCVVDADRLDAGSHFRPTARVIREDADMKELATRFEERRLAKIANSPSSPLNDAREDIYRRCLEAALGEPGIYRLHVPTGGGKTYAGAAFALNHAVAHGRQDDADT